MPFPSPFYYQTEQYHEIYNNVSGELSVERLVNGHDDYWLALTPAPEKKFKTLVINDWRLSSYQYDLVAQYELILQKLLAAGFNVYVWQGGKVAALQETSFSIGEFSIFDEMEPKSEAIIRKEMAEQLDIDEHLILVLDDYWMHYLSFSNPEVLPPRQISLHDVYNFVYGNSNDKNFFRRQQTLLEHLETLNYKKIIIDYLNTKESELLVDLMDLFPEAETTVQIRHLFINGKEIRSLAMGGTLSIERASIDKNVLQVIESLELSNFAEDDLFSILKECPMLRTLVMQTHQISSLDNALNFSLPFLSRLIFKEASNIAPDLVEKFLINFGPQLEVLLFSRCTGMPKNFAQTFDLSRIRALKIDVVNISSSNITALIKASSIHLESLILEIEENSTCVLAYNESSCLSPSHLKRLSLIGITDVESINRLLIKAEDLRILELGILEMIGPNLPWSRYEFRHLEKLSYAFRAEQDHKANAKLLSNKSIKFLRLNEARVEASNNKYQLPLLETMIFENDVNDPIRFIEHSPKLYHLYLSHFNLFPYSKKIYFPKLKEFVLQTKMIRDPLIYDFLAAHIKQLQRVDLSGNFEQQLFLLEQAHNIKKVNLNLVEIRDKPLFIKQFNQLFSNWPQLEKLKISNFDTLSLVNSSLPQLPHFRSLMLVNLYMDKACFINLLSLSSQLRELSFYKVEINTSSELNLEKIPIQPKLQFISIDDSDISYDCLKLLIRACPNLREVTLPRSKEMQQNREIMDLLLPYKVTGLEETVANETAVLDADTSFAEGTVLSADIIFYDLNNTPLDKKYIAHTRLNIFDGLLINVKPCSIKNAFTLYAMDKGELIACNAQRLSYKSNLIEKAKENPISEGEYIYAIKPLVLTPGSWQVIPSLSPEEHLVFYALSQNVNVEISYSLARNQYFIYSNESETYRVNFEFILWLPERPRPINRPSYSAVNNIKNILSSYGRGAIPPEVITKNWTGEHFLNAMRTYKVGACRHLVVDAFERFIHLQDLGVLPSDCQFRMVFSDVHAFIEMKINNEWELLSFGGYPVEWELKDNKKIRENLLRDKNEIEDRSSFSHYEFYFASPAESVTKTISSPLLYGQQLMQKLSETEQGNALVFLQTPNEAQNFSLQIERLGVIAHIPVLVIHKPDEIIYSAFSIKREGKYGVLQKVPASPLHHFLSVVNEQNTTAILVINYEHFNDKELMSSLAVLDNKTRNILVVGLMPPGDVFTHKNSEFLAHFDVHETVTLDASWEEGLPNLSALEKPGSQSVSINLFRSLNWRNLLLGNWEIQGSTLYFHKGLLARAIAQAENGVLEIQNGCWDEPEFNLFWRQALLKRRIEIDGQTIIFPENLHIVRSEGYDWQRLSEYTHLRFGLQSETLVLNHGTLEQFFINYHFDNEHRSLHTLPGILERFANQVLEINVTRTLSEDEWARFLHKSREYNVTLIVHLAEEVQLPAMLETQIQKLSMPILKPECAGVRIYQCNDVDIALKLLNKNNDHLVIDISECSSADLFKKRKASINKATLDLTFEENESILLKAIKEQKGLILKGHFSQELADALLAYILEQDLSSANILLLTANAQNFTCLPVQHEEQDLEVKYQCLLMLGYEKEKLGSSDFIASHSLTHLITYLNYARANNLNVNEVTAEEPWKGLLGIQGGVKLRAFHPETSQEESEQLSKERLTALLRVWQYLPIAFITGLTGAGKTSFVTKELRSLGYHVHLGKEHVLDWIHDTRPGKKVLFIDEANLDPSQWSIFEGLFNNPPGILIDGVYHILSEDHKVVFAGNPINYGAGRQLASLFERHGCAIEFEPLQPSFIYEKIIKPVFEDTFLQEECLNIAQKLLPVYQFICEASQDEVLISPREIQAMALFILSAHQQYPGVDPGEFAAYYAYVVGKSLIPQHLLPQFTEQFAQTFPVEIPYAAKAHKGFLLTPSRYEARQLLSDFLTLKKNLFANETQRTGGLGGMLIEVEEKEDNIGLIKSTLADLGYVDFTQSSSSSSTSSGYYFLASNLSLARKKDLLLQAFEQGMPVVVENFSTIAPLESLLNTLLMGKDQEGETAAVVGFTLIGLHQKGDSLSQAVQRRLLKYSLPVYKEELPDILVHHGLAAENASLLTKAYQEKQRDAISEHKEGPRFSDLLKAAKAEIRILRERINISLKRPYEEKPTLKGPRFFKEEEQPSTSKNKGKEKETYKPF
jgi:hypothetical protein